MKIIMDEIKKILNIKNKRVVISVILICAFLNGCRYEKSQITVFNGLPPSRYLAEFKAAMEEKKPVAVSFTAEWCPHCRKYKPVFFEVGTIYENKVTFININVDDPPGEIISTRFQVKGIPTTAFIRSDGSVYKVQVGGIEKLELVDVVNKLAKSKRRKRGQPIAPFPIEPVASDSNSQTDRLPMELIKKDDEEADFETNEKDLLKPEETNTNEVKQNENIDELQNENIPAN